MSDLPKSVRINEEGPREGFQFEKGPIPTARKIELIDSLSEDRPETDPDRLLRAAEKRARHGRRRRSRERLYPRPPA